MLELKTELTVSVIAHDGTGYVRGSIVKSVEEVKILDKSSHVYVLTIENGHMFMSMSLLDAVFELEQYDEFRLYNKELGKEVYLNHDTEELVVTEFDFGSKFGGRL